MDNAMQTFIDHLRHFDTAMLATRAPDGELHARPMAIAEVSAHGDLQFGTQIDSPKIDEITNHPDVVVTCQGGGRFLSLSGKAMIVNDKATIRELWDDSWGGWVATSADDPALRIIRVHGLRGQFWENGSSTALDFVWDAGRAALGRRSTVDSSRETEEGVKVALA